MTKAQIITRAQLYLDDTSELSTQEFSDLFDVKYAEINSRKPWEYTKKEATGTTSTTVPYIALPSDFGYLTANYNTDDVSTEAGKPVIFVGSTYTPYRVVSWSDRRSYRDQDTICFLDVFNLRLYFAKQPTEAKAVEYDYHAHLAALTGGQSPAFPTPFHPILFHEMVVDDFIIQQSDKAKSYAGENAAMAKKYYDNMCLWNANLVQL